MRARLLTWLFGAAGLSVAACGGGQAGTGGGGSGGEGTTSASSSTTATTSQTTSTTSSSTISTGSGGMPGDGNDSFATAEPVTPGTSIDGILEPTGDVDFYTIDGKKGQALYLLTTAQSSTLAFDPDTIDTIITLYDASMKQIAENNDRVPRNSQDSQLITILPADGKYYIEVQECQTWATNPKLKCGDVPKDKLNTGYSLFVQELDPTDLGNVEDIEAGNDATSPTLVTYAPTGNGGYYLSLLYGTFTSQTDVDVFEIAVPGDVPATIPSDASGVLGHYLLPSGTSGDGSTTMMGRVWLTDAADPTVRLAEISQSNYAGNASLSPHLDFTKTYHLWIEHAGTAAGTNDFYILLESLGYSNPLETDESGNDQVATAEVLFSDSTGSSYYVEGDLINGAADVDHFRVSVPSGATQFSYACTAQRAGSGLRGFKGQMLRGDGSPITGTIVNETALKDAYTNYYNIPAGETELVFKVAATSQDPVVTSSFYRCGVHFQ